MLIFRINAHHPNVHDFINFIASFECKTLTIFSLKCTNHHSNSECCNEDFCPVRGQVSSWNFKVLQWINVNESFIHSYIIIYIVKIMWWGLKRRVCLAVPEIYGKALKLKIENKVELSQVVRKQVTVVFKIARKKIHQNVQSAKAFWRYLRLIWVT